MMNEVIILFNQFFIIPPVLTLIIIGIIKHLNEEYELRDLGIDTHIIGIMYIYPLPLLLPDLFPEHPGMMVTLLFVAALLFAINAICFVKTKRQNANYNKYVRISLSLGVTVFCIGFVAAFFV
jgi:hypothetical protein